MARLVANRVAEAVEQDLGRDEKEAPKRNVEQRPPVVEGAHDEQQLRDDVRDDAHQWEHELEHEQGRRFRRRQPGTVLERRERDETRHESDDERRSVESLASFPNRQRSLRGEKASEGRWGELTHNETGVPSSTTWNPTNPFTRRAQYVQQSKPRWIAAKY